MATYAPLLLSGAGAGGRVVVVAATATPGTLIHTAVSGAVSWDEIYLWVSNVTAAAATLTIEWGGVTDPADHMVKGLSVPANSPPIAIVTGIRLNNGLIIRAFSATASALNITGNVNRIA